MQAQQVIDDGEVAAAGGTQQGRAALRVDTVDREAERHEADDRAEIASHRRSRQIPWLQRASRQFPGAPVQPFGEVAAAAGQGRAVRRLAVGGPRIRRCAVADEALDHGLMATSDGQVERRVAACVALRRVDAALQQCVEHGQAGQLRGEAEGAVAVR